MTVTLELPDQLEMVLRRQATDEGATLEGYLSRLVEQVALQHTSTSENSLPELDEDDRPWRGILVLPRTRRRLEIATSSVRNELSKRPRVPNLNWHREVNPDE